MKLEVYKITNIGNGKIYIGITNQGATIRWQKHCSDAQCGSSFPIHNAIKKHGELNFQIEILEIVEDKDYDFLKEREIYWIKEFDSYKNFSIRIDIFKFTFLLYYLNQFLGV